MPKILPISANKLRKIFELAGFVCVRIEVDHYVFEKAGCRRPVVIPDWKIIPVFIIKTNLKTAGLSREDYFRLLENA